jgi:LPXTG-motif cell wall-anchored protein
VVTVTAGTTTTVAYIGPTIEHVLRADLSLAKVDAVTGRGVPGATFQVAYDDANTGHFTTDVGTCVTVADGTCPLPALATLLPGAYEITETVAPPGYHLADPSSQVVRLIPGEVRIVHFSDAPIMTILHVHKTNVAEPGTGVPGAVYDLYAVDPGPVGGPVAPPPADAATFPSMSWYARGTTDDGGRLAFEVPIGVSWCVREHSSPVGFALDEALHCTAGPLGRDARTIAAPETISPVTLTVHKYDVSSPGTGIPGAAYDLFVDLPFPSGFTPPSVPAGLHVPAGMALFATAVTSSTGALHFTLPSGYAWCVRERTAPADYLLDEALHCTAGPLLHGTASGTTTIAAPERHVPELPYTGTNLVDPLGLGISLLFLGGVLLWRRRVA